jgi:hypothetical protein
MQIYLVGIADSRKFYSGGNHPQAFSMNGKRKKDGASIGLLK